MRELLLVGTFMLLVTIASAERIEVSKHSNIAVRSPQMHIPISFTYSERLREEDEMVIQFSPSINSKIEIDGKINYPALNST